VREPGWITKAEAAALLECDPRTIERRARAGLIATRARAGFPTLYALTDVEKLKETARGEVRTGILETVAATHKGIQTSSPQPSNPYTLTDDPLRQLCALVVQLLTVGPTRSDTQSDRSDRSDSVVPRLEDLPSWVPLTVVAAYSGLTVTYLRRMIKLGALTAVKDRGWKVRRKDLETL